MPIHFCTLFDRNYLYKGLALYHSLLAHCQDFRIWILCMDEITWDLLDKLKLEKAHLIRICEFEDRELQQVKPTRTVAEYCWTCTPSLPLYVLRRNPSLDSIAYLDADLFFYSHPRPIYDEVDDGSIMIIEHRFPPHLKHFEINGIYNVEMLMFRNDAPARECLQWWRERCIEWCYYRLEDGKLGDQKYLDDWPTRFPGVHVLQHKGAGVALWNVMRYAVTKQENAVYIDEAPLIFYHFHQFTLLPDGKYDFGNRGEYVLSPEAIEFIYRPYVAAIEREIDRVRGIDRSFNYGYGSYKFRQSESFLVRLSRLPRRMKKLFSNS
ncbi:MAG TPA: hypothetical protein VL261_09790 [Nitrospira sp.]|jgi:hypothetical protein|nr:hypothetical protein [Nitrospira sp.]